MTEIELDRAIRILGPKMVLSIKRISGKATDTFEKNINELVESKRYKIEEWYKPGEWVNS